eukprot:1155474-Pelagomonas_calceolata.AAC.6
MPVQVGRKRRSSNYLDVIGFLTYPHTHKPKPPVAPQQGEVSLPTLTSLTPPRSHSDTAGAVSV